MYIREKKSPLSKKIAIQLVKSIREGHKVKQQIIRHIGSSDNPEDIQSLRNLAQIIKEELEEKEQPLLFKYSEEEKPQLNDVEDDSELNVNLKNVIENKRIKVGIHEIYGSIYDNIGFNSIIDKGYRRKGSVKLMRDVVMVRITQPESKLSTSKTLNTKFGIKTNVNAIYRMMDLIDDEAINRIQKICYENTSKLLGGKIDVIFYDCTTLYFESFSEDELKRNGYSKDGKFNQPQVILALLVSKEGLPIGYEIFHGATFEGHTLKNALDKLHEKFKINQLVFVADSAMLSKENLSLLEERKQPYIVASRLKSLPKTIQNQFLDKSTYKTIDNSPNSDWNNIIYKEIVLNNGKQKLIVTYSPKRAAKNSFDRQKAIQQLQKRLSRSSNPKSLLNNYGYKKFLQISGQSKIELNAEKIKNDELWDGLHGVITNIKNAPVTEILNHYQGLWQIEETFRISKHNLRMRPIFHWTPRRIKSHIAICYMALNCIRTLEHRVRIQYRKLSPETIRREISALEVSILFDESTNKSYALPSKASSIAKKIYNILGLNYRNKVYQMKSKLALH